MRITKSSQERNYKTNDTSSSDEIFPRRFKGGKRKPNRFWEHTHAFVQFELGSG